MSKPPKKQRQNFIALDLETNGLNSETNQILAISAIRYIDGELRKPFFRYCKLNGLVPELLTEITKIDSDMMANAIELQTTLTELIGYLDNLPVVIYNAPFVMKFLQQASALYDLEIQNNIIDVNLLAKIELPNQARFRTIDIMGGLDLESSLENGILGRAIDTANIYITLCNLL